jgi:hypothetical protein
VPVTWQPKKTVLSGDLCPDGLSVKRVYTLFDDLNNDRFLDDGEFSAGCEENFMIVDKTAPVISCPPGILGIPCDYVVGDPITTRCGLPVLYSRGSLHHSG